MVGDKSIPDWRNDPGLMATPEYKKKFAFRRTKCSDGSFVWFKTYYKKYDIWSHGDRADYYDEGYYHKDFVENITEEDYSIRILSGNL